MTGRTAAPPFSPRFFVASLVLTLTVGAGSGMFYLWRIGAGADVPASHRQIHAYSQILGFAALFVMGVAFQALPRMFGRKMPSARVTNGILWLMVAAVVLRNLAQPFAFFALGRAASLLSGLLAAGGGTLFAVFVLQTLSGASRDASGRRDPLATFALAGTAYLLAALGVSVMQGAWIAAQGDSILPGSLTEPFAFLALQGFLLSFVYGFASRMVPGFLGTGPARRSALWIALHLQAAAMVVFSVAFVPGPAAEASLALRDVGSVLAALSALAYVGGLGVLWRRSRAGAPAAGRSALRLAFAGLALWAVLTLGGVTVARLTSFPAQNPWWTDAARHVFTIGFLTMMIVGVGHRVLPAFSGNPLWSPRLARLTQGLIVLGVALRLLQYPAAFEPRFYQVGSYMGLPVVVGLVLFTVNVVKTVRPRKEAASPLPFVSTLPAR